jgi:hypothetical protein
VALHQVRLHEAYLQGTLAEYYQMFVVSDEELERGLANGTMAIDTRLRDALRELRNGESGGLLPLEPGTALVFRLPDVREDASFAAEASVLVEIDGIVRAESRVEAFEERLAALEQGPVSRLRRLARR